MLQACPMYAYIPAKDIARARRFHEETLGFRATEESNGGLVYECAGRTAAFLYPTPNAGTSQASQAFWSVQDVDAEMKALKARGRQHHGLGSNPRLAATAGPFDGSLM